MERHSDGKRRVAFFGGTFDPPHCGHIEVARASRDALRLDTVVFAPVGAQPLKPEGSTAPFEARVRMTELAITGERGFELSTVDAPDEQGRPNYTLHTLRHLTAELHDAELFCLIGADSFLTLRHWYGASELPFAASLIVASRPGETFDDLNAVLPDGIYAMRAPEVSSADPNIELRAYELRNPAGESATLYVLPGLDIPISATAIRAQLRGHALAASKSLVPNAVAEYIREHGLYR